MAMPYQQTGPRMMPYPNNSTQEMALLGSSYPEVRVVDQMYQSVEEINESDLEELCESISIDDIDSFLALLDAAPDVIFCDDDLENSALTEEQILFVYQCRRIVRCMLVTEFLEERREAVIRGGRLIGDAEFSERMQYKGPDSDLWLSASLRKPGEVVLRG
ncbi:MAG: hypothetical protein ACOX10_01905 [Candidatus Methanomethylophilaceae archaeon]